MEDMRLPSYNLYIGALYHIIVCLGACLHLMADLSCHDIVLINISCHAISHHDIASILRPFMLRREKREVETDLADKLEKVLRCDLTSTQRVLYESIMNGSVSMHNKMIQLRKVSGVYEGWDEIIYDHICID